MEIDRLKMHSEHFGYGASVVLEIVFSISFRRFRQTMKL